MKEEKILTRQVIIEKVFSLKKIKCIDNPWGYSNIKIDETYEAIAEHPTNKDFFEVIGEGNTIAYYYKVWFKIVI